MRPPSTFLALGLSLAPFPARAGASSCLCIFDIDRTLTGKQDAGITCPSNLDQTGVVDTAYSGGTLSISELAQKLSHTFCTGCFGGIISSGPASGAGSDERRVVVDLLRDAVLRGIPRESEVAWSDHPTIRGLGPAGSRNTAFYVNVPEGTKQDVVPKIVAFHKGHFWVNIPDEQVYMFDDKRGNVEPFEQTAYNAVQVSCTTRDGHPVMGRGLCGGTLEEAKALTGVHLCETASTEQLRYSAAGRGSEHPPPAAVVPLEVACGAGCTSVVRARVAGGHTCGARIEWLRRERGQEARSACMTVAAEFSAQCGACNATGVH